MDPIPTENSFSQGHPPGMEHWDKEWFQWEAKLPLIHLFLLFPAKEAPTKIPSPPAHVTILGISRSFLGWHFQLPIPFYSQLLIPIPIPIIIFPFPFLFPASNSHPIPSFLLRISQPPARSKN